MTDPADEKGAKSSTTRARAHLVKLRKEGGQRVLVDLDAPAFSALMALKTDGLTTRAAICKALVALAGKGKGT
jgi:hypothetical protein